VSDDLTDRVADVIGSHDRLWSIDGNIQCRCKALMWYDQHAAHVAAAVVEELGLTEQSSHTEQHLLDRPATHRRCRFQASETSNLTTPILGET
jgi:hypothetical protein